MSATPQLTAHALFQSHLVNCQICNKYEYASVKEVKENVYEPNTKAATKRFLCAVGLVLLEKARREDPTKSPFKPRFFPFVGKKLQMVEAKIKGQWVVGRVMDHSLAANGKVVGYDIEVRGRIYYSNRVRKYKPEQAKAEIRKGVQIKRRV